MTARRVFIVDDLGMTGLVLLIHFPSSEVLAQISLLFTLVTLEAVSKTVSECAADLGVPCGTLLSLCGVLSRAGFCDKLLT
jgi:hypothetical protein